VGYLKNLSSALLGRPMAVIPSSGFTAATGGRRLLNVGNSTRGTSSLALADGQMLMARARKAYMDNPLVVNGIRSFIAETIGTGIRPHSRHPKKEVRQILEREFALWVAQSSAARRIGRDGTGDSLHDFYAQQGLVCHNVVVAGEAFARLRWRRAADLTPGGLRVPLQIELIQPEQLAYWRNSGKMSSPTNLIRGSIEFDQIHQRVAYHFYREHPGDSTLWPNTFEIVRVPAQDILHIMEPSADEQIRGITSLASILLALSDVDDYKSSERLRQKLGAFQFAWKKTATPEDPGFIGTTTAGNDQAPVATEYVEAQPGATTVLDTNAGEEFDFYAHPGVPVTYEAFLRESHREFAVAMRNTYEMLTGDTNQINYSSARVRLIALRRQWQQFQTMVIVHQFCRPLWRSWCDAMALVGMIDAADYAEHIVDYLAVDWRPQGWEWVDPLKDIQATRAKIESCLTSRTAEIKGFGEDPEDVDNQIEADHLREVEKGLAPVYGASRVMITEPPGDNPDEPLLASPGGTNVKV
jgi:lambda family phage portal protein